MFWVPTSLATFLGRTSVCGFCAAQEKPNSSEIREAEVVPQTGLQAIRVEDPANESFGRRNNVYTTKMLLLLLNWL